MSTTATPIQTELTTAEAAVRAQVSAPTMQRWVKANKVRSRLDVRGRRLIDAADLDRLLRTGQPTGVEAPAPGEGSRGDA